MSAGAFQSQRKRDRASHLEATETGPPVPFVAPFEPPMSASPWLQIPLPAAITSLLVLALRAFIFLGLPVLAVWRFHEWLPTRVEAGQLVVIQRGPTRIRAVAVEVLPPEDPPEPKHEIRTRTPEPSKRVDTGPSTPAMSKHRRGDKHHRTGVQPNTPRGHADKTERAEGGAAATVDIAPVVPASGSLDEIEDADSSKPDHRGANAPTSPTTPPPPVPIAVSPPAATATGASDFKLLADAGALAGSKWAPSIRAAAKQALPKGSARTYAHGRVKLERTAAGEVRILVRSDAHGSDLQSTLNALTPQPPAVP